MPKDFPEQREPNDRREREFAETAELSPADRALLESATMEAERDSADRQPATIDDEDAIYTDVGTEPMSEKTAALPDTGYDETEDGLDEMSEAVRQEAEERTTGRREDYTG